MQRQMNSSSLKKSVSFGTKGKLRLSRHIKDYDASEREAAFYTRDDYSRFKQDARLTANMIENDQPMDDSSEEFCVRGVECFTKEGSALQSNNRKTALLAVLSEQERQQAEQDPISTPAEEMIAVAYSEATRESASSARRSGLVDERLAQREGREKIEKAKFLSKCEPVSSGRYPVLTTKARKEIRRIIRIPVARFN